MDLIKKSITSIETEVKILQEENNIEIAELTSFIEMTPTDICK